MQDWYGLNKEVAACTVKPVYNRHHGTGILWHGSVHTLVHLYKYVWELAVVWRLLVSGQNADSSNQGPWVQFTPTADDNWSIQSKRQQSYFLSSSWNQTTFIYAGANWEATESLQAQNSTIYRISLVPRPFPAGEGLGMRLGKMALIFVKVLFKVLTIDYSFLIHLMTS